MDTNIIETAPAPDPQQRHQEAVERLAAARQALTLSERVLATVIRDAAAAGTVNDLDHVSAEAAVSQARRGLVMAEAIANVTLAGREQREVDGLHQQVRQIRDRYDDAIVARVQRAEAVDQAFCALQLAIEDFNATNLTVGFARSAAHAFEINLPAIARHNATLAGLDDGLRPRAALPHHIVLKPVKVAFVSVASGELSEERMVTLAGRERGLFGIVDSMPAPAHAPDMATLQPLSGMTGKAPSFTPTTMPAVLRR